MNMRPRDAFLAACDLNDFFGCQIFEHADRRAVITGIGIVTPMADDLGTLCDLVEQRKIGFQRISRFDTSWCETDLACTYPPSTDEGFRANSFQRKWMDRAVWYLLDALERALDESGVNIKDYDPERIAVVLGTSHSGLVTTEELYKAMLAGDLEKQDPRRMLAIPASHISSAVAAAIGAKGVRRTVSSACASSTAALGIGADLIRTGRADLVVTGGTDTVSLAVMAGFNSLRALAPDGCHPFSTPVGITLGEGAGVLLLERLDESIARGRAVRAEILGYALSGDAHHATAPDADGDGIRRVMIAALRDADVMPNEVDYLSAHGTGTDANDIAESRAIAGLFGDDVPLSTSKSIFGHTLGASGAIEIALLLGLAERDEIPPTFGFTDVREGCASLDYVPNGVRRAGTETLICNNYGFGGNNASVVLRRSSPVAAQGASKRIDRRSVVISGSGVVDARGIAGVDGLLNRQAENVDPTTTRFLVTGDRLPPGVKRQIGRLSPMVRYAVGATGEALATAGLEGDQNAETGLIFGVVTGAQRATEKFMESVFVQSADQASAQYFPQTTNNAPAGQVSLHYGLKGYNTTLCGSASALGYAIDLVADGRQDRVVTAGSDEHSELLERFYAHAGVLRDGPARAFDGSAGINFGEGACAIVFEAAEVAAARGHIPLATVLGFAECQDGTLSGVSRHGAALQRAIRKALSDSGVDAQAIDTIVTNGTGPGYFAAAEADGIAAVFDGLGPQRLSPVDASGYGPSQTPIAIMAAGAALVAQAEDARTQKPRTVLCATIDITGVAYAAVISSAVSS